MKLSDIVSTIKKEVVRVQGYGTLDWTANPLIAFTGLSRQGKDTAAEPLIDKGYNPIAFGDYGKKIVGEMDDAEAVRLLRWMKDTANISETEIARVQKSWQYYRLYRNSEPEFIRTQNDKHKSELRALLEWAIMWKYNQIMLNFCKDLSIPNINTRLMRVDEAKVWKDMGGTIVEIVRDNTPRTDFERSTQAEMRESGMIDYTFFNVDDIELLHKQITWLGTREGAVNMPYLFINKSLSSNDWTNKLDKYREGLELGTKKWQLVKTLQSL